MDLPETKKPAPPSGPEEQFKFGGKPTGTVSLPGGAAQAVFGQVAPTAKAMDLPETKKPAPPMSPEEQFKFGGKPTNTVGLPGGAAQAVFGQVAPTAKVMTPEPKV